MNLVNVRNITSVKVPSLLNVQLLKIILLQVSTASYLVMLSLFGTQFYKIPVPTWNSISPRSSSMQFNGMWNLSLGN